MIYLNYCSIFIRIKSNKIYMTFQERSKIGMEELSKQCPVTLEMAREQAYLLKTKSIIKKETIKYKHVNKIGILK